MEVIQRNQRRNENQRAPESPEHFKKGPALPGSAAQLIQPGGETLVGVSLLVAEALSPLFPLILRTTCEAGYYPLSHKQEGGLVVSAAQGHSACRLGSCARPSGLFKPQAELWVPPTSPEDVRRLPSAGGCRVQRVPCAEGACVQRVPCAGGACVYRVLCAEGAVCS